MWTIFKVPTEFVKYHLCLIFSGFLTSRHVGVLVPWQGVKPTLPALEGEVLTTGLPEKSPQPFLKKKNLISI